MGIYVMEPLVVEYVPADTPFDFPDLVQALLRHGQPVGAYRHEGMWFDIGRQDDYEQAVALWLSAQNDRDGSLAHNGSNGHFPRPVDIGVQEELKSAE
jgi:NDP-sugar pyrophosphorylase family protein